MPGRAEFVELRWETLLYSRGPHQILRQNNASGTCHKTCHMLRKRLFFAISAAALALLSALPATADTYPAKAIKLIVPFPAGGPVDSIARVVADKMAQLLGQPVVIESRSGAGGVTGTALVARARTGRLPDQGSPAPARWPSRKACRTRYPTIR